MSGPMFDYGNGPEPLHQRHREWLEGWERYDQALSAGSDDDFRRLRNWLVAFWLGSLVVAFAIGALLF